MRFWLVPLTLVALVVGSGALMVVLDIELAQLFGNPRRALFQAMASVGIAGLAGSVLSVLAAPRLALWQSQGRRIENASNKQEAALLEAVTRLAAKAGLHAPQLVIFPGEPNAFCVGLTRNRALLAVSDGLLYSLGRRETEAVLAHEIAHIANGDMLTLELAQGVLSLLVLWPALAMDALSRWLQGQGRRTRRGIAYSVTYLVPDRKSMFFGEQGGGTG
jgi:heat shock protein HtpX